jgi:hypothetical protein
VQTFATRALGIAKRKLDKHNPAEIWCSEFDISVTAEQHNKDKSRPWMHNLKAHVLGKPKGSLS